MMKSIYNYFRTLTCVMLLFMFNHMDLSGQNYNSGVGISLGTHFAGNYKTFLKENRSIELVAGINQGTEINIVTGGFYEFNQAIDEVDRLSWYYGFGVFVEISDVFSIAPSGIVGIEYTMEDDPFNFFLASVPLVYINSGLLDIEISLGARYVIK